MKLIENLIVTEMKEGFLLINTLNGLIDMVGPSTLEVIEKWQGMETIEAETTAEKELYANLYARGYFSESHEAEQKQKEVIITALREKQKKIQAKIETLTFIMTYDCNFRCPYCFESVEKNMHGIYLSEAQIDAALNLAGEELRHIGLFGGEPLLPKNRPVIEYIIKKAPGKSYDIVTNGFHLDQYIDLLGDINISYIMVTLDGPKHIHDQRRIPANGKPTYDIILENIRKCLRNHIPVRIRMNMDQTTLAESEKLRDELLAIFHEYAELLSFEISPMMEIEWSERNQLIRELARNDAAHRAAEKNVLLSRFSPLINTLLHGKALHPSYSYCAGHQNKYIVDPLGLIYPCLVAVGKREYAIGTFYPQAELFEHSVRKRNIESIEKCRSCAYSLLCGGGCPLKADIGRNMYQPECGSIINDVHYLLPMLLNTESIHNTRVSN